jgi:probable phosphoglycerate mutase
MRHGETSWNREGRLQGRSGSPLTEGGHEQARLLAAFARNLGIRRVVSSTLERARYTARLIADSLGQTLETTAALAEIDFGRCSGLTLSEVEERFPGFMETRKQDRWNHRWPDGESYADACERLTSWLSAERSSPPDGTAIVAHESVNRCLVVVLTGIAPEAVLETKQPSDIVIRLGSDGSVSHCRSSDGDPVRWHSGLYIPDGRLTGLRT